MKNQPVRGTRDLFNDDAKAFRFIDKMAWETAKHFGFSEIQTPILENSEVFAKSLGEASDIVNKEMYTFLDRGGDPLTLRPEGTAGIARAFISNGMAKDLPLKLYYYGPMFRYERPQKGRYRQFFQIGVEMLGFNSPQADVEALSLAWIFLQKLNLSNRCQLELNSIGDQESRLRYRQVLVDYLTKFKSSLSLDSQTRLEKNPLRILDSKDEGDKIIIADAPLITDSLSPQAKEFYSIVQDGLHTLGIPFVINPKLVRGLDYYCHSVFEFVTTDLGSQGAILSGGRYDGLISSMGGPDTSGVGWAAGVDRLALMIQKELFIENDELIAIISADDKSENQCLKLAYELRQRGHVVEQPTSGNIGKKLKRADKLGATVAMIIGENELKNQTVTVKKLKTGEQETLPMAKILS